MSQDPVTTFLYISISISMMIQFSWHVCFITVIGDIRIRPHDAGTRAGLAQAPVPFEMSINLVSFRHDWLWPKDVFGRSWMLARRMDNKDGVELWSHCRTVEPQIIITYEHMNIMCTWFFPLKSGCQNGRTNDVLEGLGKVAASHRISWWTREQ